MPADQKPPVPPNEYSIETSTGQPGSSTGDPRSRGELPPPVSGNRDWPGKARRGGASDFWALVGCNAIVFGASVCIMVLELTASRLIANYVGQSLYTWTSVIGVVLAGISIGNYLGGWLADRYQPQKVLAWLFLLSGLLTFSVLFLNGWAASASRPDGMHWQLWVMLVVAWVFFLPALSLGTISPVTASMALKRSAKTGITVGNIYAWGALGSIVGTFLTGFWLIGEFGSREVIWVTSSALVIMGALVAVGQRAFRAAALFGALPLIIQYGIFSSTTEEQMGKLVRDIAGIRSGWKTSEADFEADKETLRGLVGTKDDGAIEAARLRNTWRRERKQAEDKWGEWGERLGKQLHAIGLTLAMRSDQPDDYNDESDYFLINISDAIEEGDRVKKLRLDYLVHSYYNPENPSKLYYDYERVYAAVTLRAAALWNRPTQVSLARLPAEQDFTAAFPPAVTYDGAQKTLSVRGAMQLEDYRKLLSIGPYADYWQAVLTTWEQARNNWRKATRRTPGMIQTALDELPEGITFPDDLAAAVHYDSVWKALVCTRPFTDDECWRLIGQGPFRSYVAAVRELYYKSRRTSTMFIGGGGFVFPRWIESTFPNAPLIDVAEIDPAVQKAIETELGLATEYGSPDDDKTWIRTHIGDARKFVDDQLRANARRRSTGEPAVTYDFVYGDAFNDLSVPWHLTTREFSTKVRELLTPGQGVYLVNIIDIYPRTLYPGPSDKVAVAEIKFTRTIPHSIAPERIPMGSFAPCRGRFKALEVSQQVGYSTLRFNGAMTKEMRDALTNLDPDAAEASGPNSTFAGAVHMLYTMSNVRRFLHDPPPAGLTPVDWVDITWQPAPDPFGALQYFRTADGDYHIGLRGVMQDTTRDKLLQEAGNDETFKTAIAELYRRSREERVGQFLGRYVRTARTVFPFVYVFTSNEGQPDADRDTFVVACSLQKLNLDDLASSGGHWSTKPFAASETEPGGQLHDLGEMSSILELSRGIELTDDFAPVDNLLAPVFVGRSKEVD